MHLTYYPLLVIVSNHLFVCLQMIADQARTNLPGQFVLGVVVLDSLDYYAEYDQSIVEVMLRHIALESDTVRFVLVIHPDLTKHPLYAVFQAATAAIPTVVLSAAAYIQTRIGVLPYHLSRTEVRVSLVHRDANFCINYSNQALRLDDTYQLGPTSTPDTFKLAVDGPGGSAVCVKVLATWIRVGVETLAPYLDGSPPISALDRDGYTLKAVFSSGMCIEVSLDAPPIQVPDYFCQVAYNAHLVQTLLGLLTKTPNTLDALARRDLIVSRIGKQLSELLFWPACHTGVTCDDKLATFFTQNKQKFERGMDQIRAIGHDDVMIRHPVESVPVGLLRGCSAPSMASPPILSLKAAR